MLKKAQLKVAEKTPDEAQALAFPSPGAFL
jgi:hypothetical protein